MPIINVSGSGSSQSAPPGGPRNRPDYDAAFASNQRTQASAQDDYARALHQRAMQERATAVAEQRLQRQRESAWREHERRQREVDRAAERQSREEQRHQNQVIREDAKWQKDLERRMESREREETRLRNTQQRYERTRSSRFDRLSYQASDQLTPSKFRALQRQIDIYRREYPQHAAEIMGLEKGAGTPENAIRVAHAGRLGHMGQRAASLRDRHSLRSAERDLRIMEKDVLAALKTSAEGSPERADAVRLRSAISQARQRIVVGKGLPASAARGPGSGFGRNAGRSIVSTGGTLAHTGLDMLSADSPLTRVAGVAALVESIPFINAAAQSMLQSISRPYTDLRKSTAMAGRTSGFSSRELEAQIFQGATPPEWMKNLGMTPQDAANVLNRSGVVTRSPGEAAGVIRQVGGASLRAGMGLSMSQTGDYARNLATLGLIRPGSAPFDLQQEYDRLGKLMAQSTAAGLDHSSTLATMEGLLRAGAASGAPSVNAGGIESLFSRMLSSGAPSARTGQSEMSFLSGYNASVGSLGPGNMPLTLMVSSAMRGRPPIDDKSLARFLGMSDSDFQQLKSEPAAGRLISDYLDAARHGDPNSYRFLGQLMQNHPELAESITNKALPAAPQYLRDIAGSSAFGTGLSNYTQNSAGAGHVPLGIRNNNPLVLAAAGQPGLVGSQTAADGEKAGTFASMEAGISAGYQQILRDQQRAGGRISVRQLLRMWAPNSQSLPSYTAFVAQRAGVDPDAPIDFSGDTNTSAKVMRAMASFENHGDMVAKGAFHRGIALAQGHPQETGNDQSDINAMNANTGASQVLAGKHAFDNFANTQLVKDLEAGLSGVSTAVVRATGGIEKALADVTAALERGAMSIGHAFGGGAGPRQEYVTPSGHIQMPWSGLGGTSMAPSALK